MTTKTIFQPGNYKTRDGREARVYATDGGPHQDWLHGAIFSISSGWTNNSWYPDGRDVRHGPTPSDLMPPKRELWLLILPDMKSGDRAHLFCTRQEAVEFSVPGCALVRIEAAEGQFDE